MAMLAVYAAVCHRSLMASASARNLSIRFVRALVETGERAGIPRQNFLAMSQFDHSLLRAEEGRVPRAEFYRLCELLLDLTGVPALGLLEGEAMSGGSFNLMPQLVSTSASLRHALHTMLRFQTLMGDEERLRITEDGADVTLSCASLDDAPRRVQRFMAEVEVAGYLRLIRFFSINAKPQTVSFEHPAPAYREEYARIFEGTERFAQPFTGIAFSRMLMDVVSPYSDQELHDMLRRHAEQRAARLGQLASFSQRVRESLLQHVMPTKTTMSDVAAALGVSARSLRRRLTQEGLSYQAVVSEASAIVAKRLLSTEHRTIQETAQLMGYANITAFHRAFKRWTGTTPNTYFRRR